MEYKCEAVIAGFRVLLIDRNWVCQVLNIMYKAS